MDPKNNYVGPVIIHRNFTNTEYSKLLQEYKHKIRESDSTSANSCIFPKSNVAFIVAKTVSEYFVRPSDCQTDWTIEQTFIENVEKFQQIHRRCYLIVEGAGSDVDKRLWSQLQERYVCEKIKLLSCRTPYDTVTAMTRIAKVLCKPYSEILNNRLGSLGPTTHNLYETTFRRAVSVVGVHPNDMAQLQDGIGSLSALATSSPASLVDCGMDIQTAQLIKNFFTGAAVKI